MLDNILKPEAYQVIISTVADLEPPQLNYFLDKSFDKHCANNPNFLLYLRKEVTKEELKYCTSVESGSEDMAIDDHNHLTYIQAWIDSRLRKAFEGIEILFPYNSEIEGAQELLNVLKYTETALFQEYSRDKPNPTLSHKVPELNELFKFLSITDLNKNKTLFLKKANDLYLSLTSLNLSPSTRAWALKINPIIQAIKAIEKHKDIQEKVKKQFSREIPLNNHHVYQLPPEFNIKNPTFGGRALDTEQNAILYDLFRDKKVVGNYQPPSLATIVHYLTGWDETNLKKDLSTRRKEIRRMKRGKASTENLRKVKDLFDLLSAELEVEINKIESELKKRGS